MVWGDVVALSLILMVAVSAPVDAGPKWPWILQFAPTARLAPQVLAKTNEEASVPVTAVPVMDSAAVPVLVMTTVCDALAEPTFTEPNDKL
jgi:hypothetical protein